MGRAAPARPGAGAAAPSRPKLAGPDYLDETN